MPHTASRMALAAGAQASDEHLARAIGLFVMIGKKVSVLADVPGLAVTHWGVRTWADGSGSSLKRGYAYGKGAVIGKHLRLCRRRRLRREGS